MRKLVFVLGFLLAAASAKANDIYITQSGTGGGTSCSSPQSLAYFNNSANWGTGKPIAPGTTVHLCGTFTGTAGQQLLTVQGSGASGSPITVRFETGAVLTAPYFSSQGAINANGKSFITIDGGTNGIIQNTANGSTLANHVSSRGVYLANCTNCTVQNLTIANLYVRSSTTDVFLASAGDVNCIYFTSGSHNALVNNVTCHDAGWAITGPGNNATIQNSNVYNVDHGIAWGASGTTTGASIHDNHFHDYAAWDTNPTTDKYHHDGIHLWGQNGAIMSGALIYNNLFDGDPGSCCTTAHIFLQDQIENAAIFNNVILVHTTHTIQGIELAGETYTPTGNAAYNNFIQASDTHGPGGAAALFARKQANFTALNNVVIGGQADISVVEGGSLTSNGINNELYDDLLTDYGDNNSFHYQSNPATGNFSSWQGECACDGHSLSVIKSQINADSTGHLLTGSKGIGLGANLIQMGIATGRLAALAKDKNGVARPTTGAWDVGAYVH
jgi:hypothetical protein